MTKEGVFRTSELPSPLVFLLVSTHFTTPLGILITFSPLYSDSFLSSFPVEPGDFTKNLSKHLRISLRPMIPDNVCSLRITAAAGT